MSAFVCPNCNSPIADRQNRARCPHCQIPLHRRTGSSQLFDSSQNKGPQSGRAAFGGELRRHPPECPHCGSELLVHSFERPQGAELRGTCKYCALCFRIVYDKSAVDNEAIAVQNETAKTMAVKRIPDSGQGNSRT